jgi:hypothetical protein
MHLLATREDAFSATKVNDDVTTFEPPRHTGHNLTLTVFVLFENLGTLSLSDALNDHLLRGLSGDPAKGRAGLTNPKNVAILLVLFLGTVLVRV